MEKKYNILLDRPPLYAEVNGNSYKVNTDYRIVLAYLRLMKKDMDDAEKTAYAISLFFGDEIRMNDLKDLLEWIPWFLSKGEAQEDEKEEKLFDLIEDSNRIYAAFWQTYGINLKKIKMHWWTFSILLEGLPSGTHLSDVINIRARKFEKWMKPAAKNELQRLKDKYRLGEKRDIMSGLFSALRGICKK